MALVVVLAFSAFAAASAMASPAWQVEGKTLAGSESLKLTANTPLKAKSEVRGEKIFELECENRETGENPTALSESATITAPTKGEVRNLVLKKCHYLVGSKCSIGQIHSTLKIGLGLESTEGKEPVFTKFTPETENVFLQWSTQSCAGEGTYTVKGSARCQLHEASTQQIVKQCEFTATSGSSLTYGLNPVTFTGTVNMELAGTNKGKKWGASA